MGKYNIELEGATIKTQVTDNAALIDTFISSFRSSLASGDSIVGVDVKFGKLSADSAALLIFCAGTQCLIIQRPLRIPDSVPNFINDETFCFVGMDSKRKPARLFTNSWYPRVEIKNGLGAVELGYLAAKVLKKPSLTECTDLSEVKRELGLDSEEANATTDVDWDTKVFSHEQVKLAIKDAYAYYVCAKKLIDML